MMFAGVECGMEEWKKKKDVFTEAEEGRDGSHKNLDFSRFRPTAKC